LRGPQQPTQDHGRRVAGAYLREGELRARGGHRHVGVAYKAGAEARGVALHLGHHHERASLAQLVELYDARRNRSHGVGARPVPVARSLATEAEGPPTGPQPQEAQLGVASGTLEGIAKLSDHRRREAVALAALHRGHERVLAALDRQAIAIGHHEKLRGPHNRVLRRPMVCS